MFSGFSSNWSSQFFQLFLFKNMIPKNQDCLSIYLVIDIFVCLNKWTLVSGQKEGWQVQLSDYESHQPILYNSFHPTLKQLILEEIPDQYIAQQLEMAIPY